MTKNEKLMLAGAVVLGVVLLTRKPTVGGTTIPPHASTTIGNAIQTSQPAANNGASIIPADVAGWVDWAMDTFGAND